MARQAGSGGGGVAAPTDPDPTGLCVTDFETTYGFEPDMGDDVSWEPGECADCGATGTVFTISD